MRGVRLSVITVALMTAVAGSASGQDAPVFTPHFDAAEFQSRRQAVLESIADGIAVLQGAAVPTGYTRFRQSNEFFYLTGIESPQAYLLLDGRTRTSTLYLPHRNTRREATEGRLLSAEDADLIQRLSGVGRVLGPERLTQDMARIESRTEKLHIYTPFAPPERAATSRDLATRELADRAADLWDGGLSRQRRFVELLAERHPRARIDDLSPILDRLRVIKSPAEVRVIRRATEISALALTEIMRSVHPGTMEYEVDALARFLFLRNGAQGVAYYSLVGSGPNAWYPHYHAGGRRMQDADLLLVDVGPDFAYYTADVTRMMPVNGVFSDRQRELYGFYLACYRAILDAIRPGSVAEMARDAADQMQQIRASWKFSDPIFESAARTFVDQYASGANRGMSSLGHWVGMAVHDVGEHDGTLRPGMIFTIEPQFRVPEERIYIRLEDMILITDGGAEILTHDLPMGIDAIEATMAEAGLLERVPPTLSPLTPISEHR